MKRARRAWGWLGLALTCTLGCASAPRPAALALAEAARSSPAVVDAQTWAPQAYARARELEVNAERALERGDSAVAEALAEQANAAYEHARALTRLARAEHRRLEAEAELAEQRRVLADLQAQHQRLSAEAAGLELRADVARGALPSPAADTTPAERALARRKASEALATQARLLCMAARLLGADEAAATTLGRLDQLEQELGANRGDVFATATRLRSECLGALSAARQRRATYRTETSPGALRAAGHAEPREAPPADLLLAELSLAGAEPSRDERGVSVALRGVFEVDGSLNEAGRMGLRQMAQVAKAHPEFPLLVVGHSGTAQSAAKLGRLLEVVKNELSELGVAAVDAHAAGERQPLLPPQSSVAKERNERLELIFVAPAL